MAMINRETGDVGFILALLELFHRMFRHVDRPVYSLAEG